MLCYENVLLKYFATEYSLQKNHPSRSTTTFQGKSSFLWAILSVLAQPGAELGPILWDMRLFSQASLGSAYPPVIWHTLSEMCAVVYHPPSLPHFLSPLSNPYCGLKSLPIFSCSFSSSNTFHSQSNFTIFQKTGTNMEWFKQYEYRK